VTILKCPLKYHTAYKFTSNLEIFSSAVGGEMAVLYVVEVPPTADSCSA
jgi:hypothetical protein